MIFAAFYVIIANHCYFNVVNLYIYHCILVFLHSSVDLWRELDENVQSKTAFFKATHISKSGNDSSDAIESYFEVTLSCSHIHFLFHLPLNLLVHRPLNLLVVWVTQYLKLQTFTSSLFPLQPWVLHLFPQHSILHSRKRHVHDIPGIETRAQILAFSFDSRLNQTILNKTLNHSFFWVSKVRIPILHQVTIHHLFEILM